MVIAEQIIIQDAPAPPTAESVALAKLIERHRSEYDFYVERAKADGVSDAQDLPAFPKKLLDFSLAEYVQAALSRIEYERDEDGWIVASVPAIQGAFTQGETYEEARANLAEVIEGNAMIDLQMGWPVQEIPEVEICVGEISSPPAA